MHVHITNGLAISSIFKLRFDAGGADAAFRMMLQNYPIPPWQMFNGGTQERRTGWSGSQDNIVSVQ
jgi:hypothetical protein